MSWLDTLEEIRTRDFGKASAAEREKTARSVVNLCSYGCAVVAVAPMPFSDALLMLPIQSAMVMTVGHVYGRRIDSAAAKDLILELGAVAGVGFLARQGLKALLPVVGAVLTVPAAFAANWGIGRVAIEYFKNPGASRETLREVYEDAKREARRIFSTEELDEFRARSERKRKRPPARKPKRAPKRSPPAITVRKLVERELPNRIAKSPELARRINAVLHLDVAGKKGGQWTIDLTGPEGWVSRGLSGTPKMTVRCEDAELVRIATGKKDAQLAVLSGALQLEPMDLELAGEVGKLFA